MILSSKILFAKALSLKGVTIYLVLFYFFYFAEIGKSVGTAFGLPISLFHFLKMFLIHSTISVETEGDSLGLLYLWQV